MTLQKSLSFSELSLIYGTTILIGQIGKCFIKECDIEVCVLLILNFFFLVLSRSLCKFKPNFNFYGPFFLLGRRQFALIG